MRRQSTTRGQAPADRPLGGWLSCAGLLACLVLSGAITAMAADIDVSEAIIRLQAEKEKARACVSLLKQHADQNAIAQGEHAYAAAKREVDAVIDELIKALEAQGTSLPPGDLEAGVTRGVRGRLAFCGTVEPWVQAKPGDKNIFIDIMEDTIVPSIEAVRSLFGFRRAADLLQRKTIQTQLEATKWPEFARIVAAP